MRSFSGTMAAADFLTERRAGFNLVSILFVQGKEK
jgi:hypothetical protein